MLAEHNEYINEASKTIYQLTQDEHIRLVCEAREDYYKRQRSLNQRLQQKEDTINEQASTIDNLKARITTLENSENELAQANAQIAQLKALLKEHNIPITG